jgi:hypothetical protein
MFAFLKNHPFAVDAFFESSIVLTFAAPKDELQGLIPACLELDTFDDKWAFVAMAMVQTRALRPKGFPKMLGNDFFLMGYRIFVKYTNNAGKRLRGLYILKSETDKRRMEILGNIFTNYKYDTTDIKVTVGEERTHIKSAGSPFEVNIERNIKEALLPPDSPFNDWSEARRYAGPLPFTFSYDAETKEVTIIEGVRQNWHPAPVNVLSYDISFLKSLKLKKVQLANAFIINNISYSWKKGVTEKWKG